MKNHLIDKIIIMSVNHDMMICQTYNINQNYLLNDVYIHCYNKHDLFQFCVVAQDSNIKHSVRKSACVNYY